MHVPNGYNIAIMLKQQTSPPNTQMLNLWQALNNELAQVFDAHFVCAAIATELATHTKTMTVVGISDPQRNYYDVWICQANGQMKQKRWSGAKASFEPFIDAGKAIFLEKFDQPVADLIQSELWLLPHDHILGIALPFPAASKPVTSPGVICLIDHNESCFIDANDLEQLAVNMTVFLDRAYLRHQVDRQEIEFAVISDISHTLTSTLSLENVFKLLTGTVRRTINVESLSVGLREPTTGDIRFVDHLMGAKFEKMPTIHLKRGQGIAGWVAENREPVIINDTYADERFYSRVDRQSGFTTKSMICVPLEVEERTIGVLQAINRNLGEFTSHDLRLLQAIGGPLAAAIENARLHADVLAEKRRIETIFSSMSEGMLTVNSAGLITNSNDAMAALLQKELDSYLGSQVDKIVLLQPGNIDGFRKSVYETEDDYIQIAADLIQSNGELVPVLVSGASVKNDQGEITEIIFAFGDLTQVREVERMRDDFFHGIVHELRTPLATILMYARLLREGKARDEEKAARFLGVIERESDRLQNMVRQMLLLAKQESRESQRSPEAVLINPILEELLPPLTDQAIERGLTFIQKVEPDLPAVLGIVETLHLIFKNLIDNAIKFTLSGSVRVSAFAEGETVILRVADEGIGIPQQALPNLFKRFYRTQTAVERGIAGTGLGLYMVKESVERFGGTIRAESQEGKGSTFTVILPTVQDFGTNYYG